MALLCLGGAELKCKHKMARSRRVALALTCVCAPSLRYFDDEGAGAFEAPSWKRSVGRKLLS